MHTTHTYTHFLLTAHCECDLLRLYAASISLHLWRAKKEPTLIFNFWNMHQKSIRLGNCLCSYNVSCCDAGCFLLQRLCEGSWAYHSHSLRRPKWVWYPAHLHPDFMQWLVQKRPRATFQKQPRRLTSHASLPWVDFMHIQRCPDAVSAVPIGNSLWKLKRNSEEPV